MELKKYENLYIKCRNAAQVHYNILDILTKFESDCDNLVLYAIFYNSVELKYKNDVNLNKLNIYFNIDEIIVYMDGDLSNCGFYSHHENQLKLLCHKIRTFLDTGEFSPIDDTKNISNVQ